MKVKVMGAGVVILTILAGGQYYTQASYIQESRFLLNIVVNVGLKVSIFIE